MIINLTAPQAAAPSTEKYIEVNKWKIVPKKGAKQIKKKQKTKPKTHTREKTGKLCYFPHLWLVTYMGYGAMSAGATTVRC